MAVKSQKTRLIFFEVFESSNQHGTVVKSPFLDTMCTPMSTVSGPAGCFCLCFFWIIIRIIDYFLLKSTFTIIYHGLPSWQCLIAEGLYSLRYGLMNITAYYIYISHSHLIIKHGKLEYSPFRSMIFPLRSLGLSSGPRTTIRRGSVCSFSAPDDLRFSSYRPTSSVTWRATKPGWVRTFDI